METVKMSHPDLNDRVIEVPASAVSEHRLSGWKLVDESEVADAELAALKQREAELLRQKATAEKAAVTDDKKSSAKKPSRSS